MNIFQTRIKLSREILKDEKLDALLVTNASNIYYLTGLSEFPENERDCRIVITKKQCYLFTDFRYSEAVTTKASHVRLIEISHNTSFIDALGRILREEQIQHVGIEGDSLTVSEEKALLDNFPSQSFIPVEKLIEQLRIFKDTSELTSIQKACELTDKTFDFIVRHVKGGVEEKELAWEIEKFIKEHGGELAFPSIVAFGNHSAIPHHSPSNKKLSRNDTVVLLDFGARVDGYSSDMTRTFFVKTPDEKIKKAYSDLLKIQQDAIGQAGNFRDKNFKSSSLQKDADSTLTKLGYPPIPHALGHGVGIDTHELPFLSPYSENILDENMVFTIEPGIYIPGEFGIRIEDTIILEESAIPVTRSSKEELIISLPE